jgi:hypothetical protein
MNPAPPVTSTRWLVSVTAYSSPLFPVTALHETCGYTSDCGERCYDERAHLGFAAQAAVIIEVHQLRLYDLHALSEATSRAIGMGGPEELREANGWRSLTTSAAHRACNVSKGLKLEKQLEDTTGVTLLT